MKTKILSLFFTIISISCVDRRQHNNDSGTKIGHPLQESIDLQQIQDSIQKVDSLITITIDTSKNRISINQIRRMFKDTTVSNKTFPWIANTYRCPVKRIIGNRVYESRLYAVFCKDTVSVDQIDSFCRKMILPEKTNTTYFQDFYGGKHAIIFHMFYVGWAEDRKYSDTLFHNVQAALVKCGYRRYNTYLFRF